MTRTRFVLLAALALLVIGCSTTNPTSISGSGTVETISFGMSGFTKVDVSTAFSATISHSNSYQVKLKVDRNLLEHLQVIRRGDTLHIGLKPGINLRGKLQMDAEITMPSLEALDLSGVSQARIAGFASNSAFQANLSGTSSLDGSITCGPISLVASGVSRIDLSGQGTRLNANASGASTIDLERFTSGDSTTEASGTSTITVRTNDALNASASGASKIFYVGNPAPIVTNISGVSEVRRK